MYIGPPMQAKIDACIIWRSRGNWMAQVGMCVFIQSRFTDLHCHTREGWSHTSRCAHTRLDWVWMSVPHPHVYRRTEGHHPSQQGFRLSVALVTERDTIILLICWETFDYLSVQFKQMPLKTDWRSQSEFALIMLNNAINWATVLCDCLQFCQFFPM